MISLVEITQQNFLKFQEDILYIEKSAFPSPWDLNAFSKEIDRSISHVWALVVDDFLAGYICFWIFAGEIHLMNVAVHQTCRGKGWGYRLVSKMIEVGVTQGAETAWLEVRPSNLTARALYKKVGFVEVGRRPRYYTDTREDAIIMSIPLK
jgi:ribosomal-protein-alanine N-acetyltransferase